MGLTNFYPLLGDYFIPVADIKVEVEESFSITELLEQELNYLCSELLKREAFIQPIPYVLPLELEVRINRLKFDPTIYKDIADDMKNYLDLKKILKVSAFERKTGDPSSNLMGNARRRDWHSFEINIWVRENASPFLAVATLAHEIAHAFLDYHGIKKEDEDENERLTDITAIFIGFGDIYVNSRPQPRKEKYNSDSITTYVIDKSSAKGYLKNDEVLKVRDLVKVYKERYLKSLEKIKKVKAQEELLKENFRLTKESLLDTLDLIQSKYEQNVNVINNLTEPLVIKDPVDRPIFIENYRQVYSSLELQSEISALRKRVEKAIYENGLQDNIQTRIDELALTITSWNHVLGKYL